MLDLVPLAGARWKMTNLQPQFQPVRQVLQCHFPQTASVTVAATTVRRDHQFPGPRKALATHIFIPPPDALGCEIGSVMINADADPALIVGHVVDTIGNGLAQLLVLEIMDAHLLGSALGSPFLARILEISQQFLLLRVDRHDRLAAFLYPSDLLADVLELGVTVWVVFAFAGLAVGLQTVTRRIEQKGHRAVADRVVLPSKFLGQLPRAFASPAQRRLRMAARHRIHQSIQGVPQTRIGLNQKFAPTTRTTNAWAGQRLHSLLGFQLAHAGQNRCPGNPRGVGYMADAAPAQLHSFRGGPLSPHAFVHNYSKGMELSPSPFDSSCIKHTPDGPQPTKTSNINLTRLFFRGSLAELRGSSQPGRARNHCSHAFLMRARYPGRLAPILVGGTTWLP